MKNTTIFFKVGHELPYKEKFAFKRIIENRAPSMLVLEKALLRSSSTACGLSKTKRDQRRSLFLDMRNLSRALVFFLATNGLAALGDFFHVNKTTSERDLMAFFPINSYPARAVAYWELASSSYIPSQCALKERIKYSSLEVSKTLKWNFYRYKGIENNRRRGVGRHYICEYDNEPDTFLFELGNLEILKYLIKYPAKVFAAQLVRYIIANPLFFSNDLSIRDFEICIHLTDVVGSLEDFLKFRKLFLKYVTFYLNMIFSDRLAYPASLDVEDMAWFFEATETERLDALKDVPGEHKPFTYSFSYDEVSKPEFLNLHFGFSSVPIKICVGSGASINEGPVLERYHNINEYEEATFCTKDLHDYFFRYPAEENQEAVGLKGNFKSMCAWPYELDLVTRDLNLNPFYCFLHYFNLFYSFGRWETPSYKKLRKELLFSFDGMSHCYIQHRLATDNVCTEVVSKPVT